MAFIDEIIKIEIQAGSAVNSRKDLGTGLILGNSAPDLDGMVKSYSTLAEVAADFNDPAMPEYVGAKQYFSQVFKSPKLLIGQKPADDTYLQAYNAIQAINPDFYAVMMVTGTNQEKKLVSDVVNTEQRIFIASSQEPELLTNADGSIAKLIGAAPRTIVLYSSKANEEQPHCAFAGALIPLDAGSASWAYKNLNGVTVDKFTSTQRTALETGHVNFYTELTGGGVTYNGVTLGGGFVDTVQGLDWLNQRLKETIALVFKDNLKVDFNNDGIALIDNAIRSAFQEAVNRKIINADYTVTTPNYLDVSTEDRAARTLRNVVGSATLTGAIQKVDKIQITVTA